MDQIQIADYLAKKVFNGELITAYYIMLKNKQIYYVNDYGKLVESYKISPEDAFMFIDYSGDYSEDESCKDPISYLFPLIKDVSIFGIMYSYLAKLGFYEPGVVYSATGLKYYTVVVLFKDRLVIEIVDINTVATNTGLRKITADVLGKGILTQKEISFDQIFEITINFREQKLFVGYTLGEAYIILKDYYENHNTSLVKDALVIINAYNRVFEPYRVVYDTTTRQQVLI
jgi:hypothetical protein